MRKDILGDDERLQNIWGEAESNPDAHERMIIHTTTVDRAVNTVSVCSRSNSLRADAHTHRTNV